MSRWIPQALSRIHARLTCVGLMALLLICTPAHATLHLIVDPTTGVSVSGTQGGPFTPASTAISVISGAPFDLNYTGSKTQDWITLVDNGTGTVSPGQSTTIDIQINSNANALAPGIYTDTVQILNTTNSAGDAQIAVTLTVTSSGPGSLNVTPTEDFTFFGLLESFSSPRTKTYMLENLGGEAIDFSVAEQDAPGFISVSQTSGTLNSGATTTVNVMMSGTQAGTFDGRVSFTNTTNGTGNTSRNVNLVLTQNPFASPKSQRVASPYWQVDNGSYTFVTVTHPSLTGMNSQIGVSVAAVTDTGGVLASFAEFTLQPNQTKQLFIVKTNNASINPNTLPNASFMIGLEDGKGQLVVSPIASAVNALAGTGASQGRGYPDVTQLNLWGAVVVQGSTTGFAMEFIGDNQDSRAFNAPYFSGVN